MPPGDDIQSSRAKFLKGKLNPREQEILTFVQNLLGGYTAEVVMPKIGAGDVPVTFPDRQDAQLLGEYLYQPFPENAGSINLFGDRVKGATAFDSSATFAHELGHWIDRVFMRRPSRAFPSPVLSGEDFAPGDPQYPSRNSGVRNAPTTTATSSTAWAGVSRWTVCLTPT